jgi:hypothetical protein
VFLVGFWRLSHLIRGEPLEASGIHGRDRVGPTLEEFRESGIHAGQPHLTGPAHSSFAPTPGPDTQVEVDRDLAQGGFGVDPVLDLQNFTECGEPGVGASSIQSESHRRQRKTTGLRIGPAVGVGA